MMLTPSQVFWFEDQGCLDKALNARGRISMIVILQKIYTPDCDRKYTLDRVVVRSRSQIVKPDALFVVFLGIKWAHDILEKNRS